MSDTINILRKQLEFCPDVHNVGRVAFDSVVVGGMGGSALAALAIRWVGFSKPLVVHRDYGMPSSVSDGMLYVAVSHSGNTEETLSFANAVLEKGLSLAVVAGGGALLDLAEERALLHVKVPADFQPRDSTFFHIRALAALFGVENVVRESDIPEEGKVRAEAERVATALYERIPLIYASTQNDTLAYIWKIILNETAKVPAFSNVFPEFNHNELQGIDPQGPLGGRAPLKAFVLEDPEDHSRVTHRMIAFNTAMAKRGLEPLVVPGSTGARSARFVWHWTLAREVAHLLAEKYGIPADTTPLIEEFKKLL